MFWGLRRIMIVSNVLVAIFIILSTSINGSKGDQDEDIPHNEVRNWALKFGVDLWEFGKHSTKINDIESKYKEYEMEVVRKDGIILQREMAKEVKNFMDFKMNAVKRIMDSAQQAALSDSDRESQPNHAQMQLPNGYYDAHRMLSDYAPKESTVKQMRRFERLPVNLSASTILSAVGVDLSEDDIKKAIQWSAHLDPIFANNLERDPSISWQYFGSSSGFLRRYPGTHWPPEGAKSNINDFRTEDWFIQAASSPKDILILLDTSSSMASQSFQLAAVTVGAILDTLGDDDFVNLVTYSDIPKSAVPCFKDKLVRATPDNVKEIKVAMQSIKLDNAANLTAGFEYAFEILHRYNQSSQGSQCNQAIMLVTDGIKDSYTDIIKHYNWPHMPVRLFSYLIGGDSSSEEHMYWMACFNKGFFTKIKTAEEARRKILQYALVMARPMVLYQRDHPVHWSPVFMGGRSSGLGRENKNKRRLITTVTTPVFDRRNYTVRAASLLGVVGTDVPIEEIQKMVPQYKLGVNGYSFIVDNNGRVLYHPDLRPQTDGSQYSMTLKPKYNSIDLTEVELPESDANSSGDRHEDNANMLADMRHEMVLQKEGETEFTVLVHEDDMKRVGIRSLKFFYGPITGTPFSLAIALPQKYGMHELRDSNAQQQIRHAHMNVTDHFKGTFWKVHPDWVYCEYNNLHDLERERETSGESNESDNFETPEEQLLHFLNRTGRPGWKWMSVRPTPPQPPPSPQPHHYPHYSQQHHNQNSGSSRKAEPYYCDRNLVQSLVRDAIVTDGLDRPYHPSKKEDKQQGIQMFGVVVSFVATRSGLLRWIDHITHTNESAEPHFSETNARAMDMTWYKRAVEQHSIDTETFVFSVPFNSGYTGKSNKTLVTAAHAIFIDHRGHKAPAAVVGLQIQHESLARHFINITSACTGSSGGCKKTCASDELDCYLLDDNGFVLVSENNEHTGRFFGQIDGTIMDSLVQDRIYRRVGLMDYQGLCSDSENTIGGVNRLQPSRHLHWLLKYIISLGLNWLSYMPTRLNAWPQVSYDTNEATQYGEISEENGEYDDYYFEPNGSDEFSTTPETEKLMPPARQPIASSGPRIIPDPLHARPCDLQTNLYILQPDRLNVTGQGNPLKGKLTNCHSSGCERPFSVQKIPHSNLILLVVDTLCPCGSKQLDIEPQEVAGGSGACGNRRLLRERLPRKRPATCISYHPEETEIQQCGRGTTVLFHSSILVSLIIFSFVTILTHA